MSSLEGGGRVSAFTPTRRRVQDVDLRLGLSKAAMLSNSRSTAQAVTIVVEDDDDDVRVSSPRSVAQARSYACTRSQRPVHIPVLDDDDLELRLGPAGLGPALARSESSVAKPRHASIDITHAKGKLDVKHIGGKRKQSQPPPEPPKEMKLTCAICMDTMKDETSTVCGHIFCNNCIVAAMQVKKCCPTCRKRLTNNQIHRIYLSGSTS